MKTFPYLLLSFTVFASCTKKETPNVASVKPISQVVGIARIEPEQGLIEMSAGASGRIISLPVAENALATKGESILIIDSSTDQAQMTQARAKIGTQRAAIAAQEASVAGLKILADKAQADYELNQKLLAVKGVTGQTLRDSEVNAAKAQQDYQKGLTDLKQTTAKITELNADVAYYATVAVQKTVKSPYSGKLLEWKVAVGDYVTAATAVAQLAPAGRLIARTEVDELFAERVKIGQKADVFSQATGKRIGSGVVYFTADFLKKKSLFADETSQEDRRVREVRIRLNPDASVLINGRVDCTIYLSQ